MRKILAMVLILMVAVGSVSALADITLIHNKVEIGEALTKYAETFNATHDFKVNIISAGGSIDYETAVSYTHLTCPVAGRTTISGSISPVGRMICSTTWSAWDNS